MKKLIVVFVTLLIGVNWAVGASAKEDPMIACKKLAEEKKITKDKARFIYDCVKKTNK
ncbi:MAG: hypothetical protein HQL84_02755 [Magnetococcales bacterium]|nr:hypothetical protein [Magnetococcales bacterium]MBF0148946.1 hypothetical protein [Magnetococcales bacterium]MBF0347857.1 hypothetical protein [Magnetococcales bacterium]MBF0631184.1 hypothetical protein [Magnetococcales bacterium]